MIRFETTVNHNTHQRQLPKAKRQLLMCFKREMEEFVHFPRAKFRSVVKIVLVKGYVKVKNRRVSGI